MRHCNYEDKYLHGLKTLKVKDQVRPQGSGGV